MHRVPGKLAQPGGVLGGGVDDDQRGPFGQGGFPGGNFCGDRGHATLDHRRRVAVQVRLKRDQVVRNAKLLQAAIEGIVLVAGQP